MSFHGATLVGAVPAQALHYLVESHKQIVWHGRDYFSMFIMAHRHVNPHATHAVRPSSPQLSVIRTHLKAWYLYCPEGVFGEVVQPDHVCLLRHIATQKQTQTSDHNRAWDVWRT